ncbi:hypothetical protein IC582_019519 [Cucumis melo]
MWRTSLSLLKRKMMLMKLIKFQSFKNDVKMVIMLKLTIKNNIEYLYITFIVSHEKCILETLSAFSSGLYYTHIRVIETYATMNLKFMNLNMFTVWHDRLSHPGSIMMRIIIENSYGHPLKNQKILQSNELSCIACSQGKLIIRPSPTKVGVELPTFLERIHGDICGPINPPSGPFRYFMVLIDASSRWSHVCLLLSQNLAFARLLAQIIKLRAQFPDYTIKNIRLDNAGEFTSQAFNNYCMSTGTNIEHLVAHVHTQNGLAESFIKHLQLIVRPLLMRVKLPLSIWGHAILHAASLIRIRPTSYHKYSPTQLAYGQEPNISHLRIFGCAVYVPIFPPQRTKMGPQRRLGIYVGFESPSIIRYRELLTGDVFTARFADCHFNETNFSTLGGGIKKLENEITWNVSLLSHLDPRTKQCELEVQKIIHLQSVANQMPDAFTDTKKVTKSYIPAANAPSRIEIPTQQVDTINESTLRQKRGRPMGSKDKNPRKRKVTNSRNDLIDNRNIQEKVMDTTSGKNVEETQVYEDNNEISINYTMIGKRWNRINVVVNNIFAYNVAHNIIHENEDYEPKSVNECRNRKD